MSKAKSCLSLWPSLCDKTSDISRWNYFYLLLHVIVRICQEYCQTKPECCPNAECGKYLRLLELLREVKRGEDDVCIFGWFADFFLKLSSMVSRYCDFNKTIRIVQQTVYYWAKNKALSRIYQFIHSRKKPQIMKPVNILHGSKVWRRPQVRKKHSEKLWTIVIFFSNSR